MGVEKLNTLVKACDGAVFELKISELSGRKVAIDAYIWLNAYLSGARNEIVRKTNVAETLPDQDQIREQMYKLSLKFVLEMLEYGITPVFVFDSEKTHSEKKETQEKRTKTKIKTLDKISELYAKLDSVFSYDYGVFTLTHNEDWDPMLHDPNVVKELEKRVCNINWVPRSEFLAFEEVLRKIGIPCIRAEAEAEKLCTSLCLEGKVCAVMSTDTDTLALGCPLVIRKKITKYGYQEEKVFECVRLDKILSGLKIDQDQFVDLCICLGTDFGPKLKGKGPAATLELIQKHKSIEGLTLPKPDRYQRIREIFEYEPSKISEEQLEIQNVEGNVLDEVLEPLGVGYMADSLIIRYRLMGNIERSGTVIDSITERFFYSAPIVL